MVEKYIPRPIKPQNNTEKQSKKGISAALVSLAAIFSAIGVGYVSKKLPKHKEPITVENTDPKLPSQLPKIITNSTETPAPIVDDPTKRLNTRINEINFKEGGFFDPNLDAKKFCLFYNNWLANNEKELSEVWKFFIDQKNNNSLPKESLDELNNIVSFVTETKKNFAEKSIFTKERLAASSIPGTETEIINKLSGFLNGEDIVPQSDCNKAFTITFTVIGRNSGMKDGIQNTMESLILAMKYAVEAELNKKTLRSDEMKRVAAISETFVQLLEKLRDQK